MRISDWSSDVCSSDLGGVSVAAVEIRPQHQVLEAVAVDVVDDEGGQHAGEAGGQVAAIGGDVEPEPRVGGVEEGELRRLERLLTVARCNGTRSDRAVALHRYLAVFDQGPAADAAQLQPQDTIRIGTTEVAKRRRSPFFRIVPVPR